MKKELKIPNDQEIQSKFEKVMENIYDTDLEDFKTVFKAGLDFMIQYQQPKITIDESLGFPIDPQKVVDIWNGKDTYWEEKYNLEDKRPHKVEIATVIPPTPNNHTVKSLMICVEGMMIIIMPLWNMKLPSIVTVKSL